MHQDQLNLGPTQLHNLDLAGLSKMQILVYLGPILGSLVARPDRRKTDRLKWVGIRCQSRISYLLSDKHLASLQPK